MQVSQSNHSMLMLIMLVVGALMYVLSSPPEFVLELNELDWLPYVAGGIAISVTMQYGFTRLTFIALLFLMFQVTAEMYPETKFMTIYRDMCPTWFAGVVAYMSLQQDREVNLYTFSSTLIAFCGIAAIVLVANIITHLIGINPYVGVANFALPAGSVLIYVISIGMTIFTFYKKHSNTAASMVMTVLVIVSSHLFLGHLTNAILMTVVPIVFIISVQVDGMNMAFRDELTKIDSRRALKKASTGVGKRYTVIMADVDHFKKFNDTYGHETGDDVLKVVASIMNKVGGGGRAFRYGGEEFTLLFNNKTPDQVKEYVEEVRRNIQAYQLTIRTSDREQTDITDRGNTKQGETVSVTCSFGMAMPKSPNEDFWDVIGRADKTLYTAKENGRNRVEVAA